MTETTHSAEETKAIAAKFALTLKGGEIVLLLGDLGAGKTTFVQGLCAALGVTDRVKSPTFTVMHEYAIPHPSSTISRVAHLDLYRFTDARELRALALDDERRPDSVVVIEWPNAIAHDFAADATVTIAHAGGDARCVTIARR